MGKKQSPLWQEGRDGKEDSLLLRHKLVYKVCGTAFDHHVSNRSPKKKNNDEPTKHRRLV
jgi:hypothetical protein